MQIQELENLLTLQNHTLKSQLTSSSGSGGEVVAAPSHSSSGSSAISGAVALDSIAKMIDELIHILETGR
jgi:hypothetical protein